MSFCANCGRPRDEDARFCGTCGTEYSASPDLDLAPAPDPASAADTAPNPDPDPVPDPATDTAPAPAADPDPDPAPAADPDSQPPAHEAAAALADATRIDPLADATRIDPAADATRIDPAVDGTRIDPLAGLTRIDPLAGHTRPSAGQTDSPAGQTDPPADQTDPFASWYRPREQAGTAGDDTDEHWQPTQTVRSGSTQPGYPPPVPSAEPPASPYLPAQPHPPYPPGEGYSPVPPSAGQNRRRRRGLFIVLAAVVMLAAGGGAYAVANSLGRHTSAPPAAQSSGTASAPSASSTPSVTPSPALSLVSIAPGVASSIVEPKVEDLLSHYFHGINTRDYAEYASTLDPAKRAKQPRSVFDSGYATTTDSGMTLASLASGSDGGLTATVTFTSRQSAAESVDESPCNDWQVNYSLVPRGSGYLIGLAPAGYQPTYTNC
jgi:hypothetical protein